MTSKNGDRRTVQPIRITSRASTGTEKSNQFNWFIWRSANVKPKRDLSCSHFAHHPRVQVKQHVLHQQSYIPFSTAYPIYQNSN